MKEHGKQLIKSRAEKEFLSFLKQKESKQIDLNNLIYYFKGESDPKHFISFKVPLAFYKNIKDRYIILEKSRRITKK